MAHGCVVVHRKSIGFYVAFQIDVAVAGEIGDAQVASAFGVGSATRKNEIGRASGRERV
jgi:hypothetical protein